MLYAQKKWLHQIYRQMRGLNEILFNRTTYPRVNLEWKREGQNPSLFMGSRKFIMLWTRKLFCFCRVSQQDPELQEWVRERRHRVWFSKCECAMDPAGKCNYIFRGVVFPPCLFFFIWQTCLSQVALSLWKGASCAVPCADSVALSLKCLWNSSFRWMSLIAVLWIFDRTDFYRFSSDLSSS